MLIFSIDYIGLHPQQRDQILAAVSNLLASNNHDIHDVIASDIRA